MIEIRKRKEREKERKKVIREEKRRKQRNPRFGFCGLLREREWRFNSKTLHWPYLGIF